MSILQGRSLESCRPVTRTLCKTIAGVWVAAAAATVHADAVTEWNAIMQATVETADPFLRLRTAAIMHVAVFDAVNSIGREHEPYLRRIPASPRASKEAAAIAAAHRVLSVLHPEAAATLHEQRDRTLAAAGGAVHQGTAVGIAAADAILALRAHDGSDAVVPYTPGTDPGEWQPTPPDFIPAFMPGLGRVDPFSLRDGAQFRLEPPPALDSARYLRDYAEVKRVGDAASTDRPQDRTDVARFYALTEPVGIWCPAARQAAEAQGTSLTENARIFAWLAMAIVDGAIAVFDTKYSYNLWRPVTAIRASGDTTPGDTSWLPLVDTPPFPTYPSGHAGFGAAARRVLEHAFGEHGHSMTLTNPLVPDVALHYTTFEQITRDIDDGRIYGGVHFRFDQEDAARLGRRVGQYILEHELQPRRKDGCGCGPDGAATD
jgi:hypothetical protein